MDSMYSLTISKDGTLAWSMRVDAAEIKPSREYKDSWRFVSSDETCRPNSLKIAVSTQTLLLATVVYP